MDYFDEKKSSTSHLIAGLASSDIQEKITALSKVLAVRIVWVCVFASYVVLYSREGRYTGFPGDFEAVVRS